MDFSIFSTNPVSVAFKQLHLSNFEDAASFIQQLPYRRNQDPGNPLAVLVEQCGTCSSKHALLKRLADENGFSNMQLVLGIYKMNEWNTPSIGEILKRAGLEYIPEAHCYLRYDDRILDFTAAHWDPGCFIHELLEEMPVSPEQIPAGKVRLHKNYLSQWLKDQPEIPHTLEDLWAIRESCIEALSARY
ncbi:MAG TPA: hypothetical protein VFX48_01275 [Saprospiraceae bacterium]|nr:hypothetical protein [Saprospiraceae bacterium]